MHFAHIMVLVAALLPYATVGGAKSMPGYDNTKPRDSLAGLAGWRARANWAHQNHFEAFAPFAAAVILAELSHANQGRIDMLAGAFIAIRLAYTFAYVSNAASVRSLIWMLGLVCVIWLFALSI
jgi:uncharacterized MAPEG superfamily protein